MSNQDRYEAFMAELRELLRRYDAEIRMKDGGYGPGGDHPGPDVLEVSFGWRDTHQLPSCVDKDSR